MVRPVEIPQRDYDFMQRFFADDPETWEEIKEDVAKLRCWAKTIRKAGWYDPDDKNVYEYAAALLDDDSLKITRSKKAD